jgi:pimeloyl-ACP methyl ester carboxylesterase
VHQILIKMRARLTLVMALANILAVVASVITACLIAMCSIVILVLFTHSGLVAIALSLAAYMGLSLRLSTVFSQAFIQAFSAKLSRRAIRLLYPNQVAIGFIAVTTLWLAWLLLVPRSIPAAVRPVLAQDWQLPNGDRIAYIHLSPARLAPVQLPAVQNSRSPIVFLHGGPGIGLSLDSDLNFFSGFAEAGYDIYKYDQVGSGFSSRLADVQQYTIARQVEDLELIRQQIGAAQMILWGQSWGGSLAQNYLARYPDRVTQLILTSSGAPWWTWQPEPINGSALFDHRLSLRERLGYAIAPHDPIAAAQLMSQAEGGYAWTVATDGLDFLRSINYCPDVLPPRVPVNLLDRADRVSILVNRLITASVTRAHSPKSRLRGNATPVLYMRGLCDFPIPQQTIREYAALFTTLQLVQLRQVSHKLWNAPHTEQVAPMILAFLNNQPTLPLPIVAPEAWISPEAWIVPIPDRDQTTDRYNQR